MAPHDTLLERQKSMRPAETKAPHVNHSERIVEVSWCSWRTLHGPAPCSNIDRDRSVQEPVHEDIEGLGHDASCDIA